MSKRKSDPTPAPAGPFNDAFSKLREHLPEGYTPPAPTPTAASGAAASPAAKAPARAVVRMERKGRGGKEATVVEKLELRPAELERWADALKRALGCGGGVEGDAIAVQGDQRDRVVKWLEARGVRKVVRG
jgi:translation initiation factor 1